MLQPRIPADLDISGAVESARPRLQRAESWPWARLKNGERRFARAKRQPYHHPVGILQEERILRRVVAIVVTNFNMRGAPDFVRPARAGLKVRVLAERLADGRHRSVAGA